MKNLVHLLVYGGRRFNSQRKKVKSSLSQIWYHTPFGIIRHFNSELATKIICSKFSVEELILASTNFYMKPRILLKANALDKIFRLKEQSCISYNNKYIIASTQIANTEIFAFIAVQVFKLLSRKILFINGKDNRNR